jgi:hypothetical protein
MPWSHEPWQHIQREADHSLPRGAKVKNENTSRYPLNTWLGAPPSRSVRFREEILISCHCWESSPDSWSATRSLVTKPTVLFRLTIYCQCFSVQVSFVTSFTPTVNDLVSNCARNRNFFHATVSKPFQASTLPPTQMDIPGTFVGKKAASRWKWPVTSIRCRDWKVWSPILTPKYFFILHVGTQTKNFVEYAKKKMLF